jgi:hypothetical protein
VRYLLILVMACSVHGEDTKPHLTDRPHQLKENKVYHMVKDHNGKVWYAECGSRK